MVLYGKCTLSACRPEVCKLVLSPDSGLFTHFLVQIPRISKSTIQSSELFLTRNEKNWFLKKWICEESIDKPLELVLAKQKLHAARGPSPTTPFSQLLSFSFSLVSPSMWRLSCAFSQHSSLFLSLPLFPQYRSTGLTDLSLEIKWMNEEML